MLSDVEVGAFLSGGVDSGYLSAASGADQAFTVGFDEGNRYNEVSKAATEGASGTTDIADKTGIIVERANEIKEKAEAARIAADKLQQNVEHFIV